MKRLQGSFWIILILLLAGCQQIFSTAGTTPGTAVTPTQTSPTETKWVLETPASQPGEGTVEPGAEETPPVIRVWLPPQLNPNSGTPDGELLKARLNEFSTKHSGVQLDVRIKALDGPGGMLDALATASAAAPRALPDLVALPRPILEVAALKGLVFSFDDVSTVLSEKDWFGYALELGRLQQSTFGLPFAGNALIFVYRPVEGMEPPRTWGRLLGYPGTWAFAAADPEALYTLAQYQALGGRFKDEQGRPMLDGKILGEVLTFYINALQAGQVSDRLAQYESEEQVWNAFLEGQYPMGVTWSSPGFADSSLTLMAPPTQSGATYTLATGWCWALANPERARRISGAELAEFLVESEFLGEWSAAGGFLPPRAEALQGWQSESRRTLAVELSEAARLAPSPDVLSTLGPVLQQAVLQVLRQEKTAIEAAQIAAQSLGNP